MKTKPIKGYEGLYTINTDGAIWSFPRTRTNGQFWKGRFLKFELCKGNGYLRVGLYKQNGIRKKWTLHKLLALHFIPNPKGFREINHIDGVRHNDRLSNLEWCDRSYNLKDEYKRGRIPWNKGKLGVQKGPNKDKKLINGKYVAINKEKKG